MKAKRIALIPVLFLFIQMTQAQGTSADFVPTDKQKDWGFAIAPYVMFAAQSTDVGGEKIRSSFNDLSSITNSGFQLIGAVRYKKWTALVDGTFAHLGYDDSSEVLNIDLKIVQTILDLRLGYNVYENFQFDEDEVLKGWSLNVNAGTKYWRNDLGIGYKLGIGDTIITEGNIDEIQRWWDLMIGVNFRFVLSKKVLLGVSASSGGFGIGKSNDFSYDFTYSNSFLVSDLIMINAGFRNFRYNRTDGAGETELETTVNVLGPLIGVTFKL
ncbi:hypothetical protein [Urechidicola vernalis]|uniref:Outer membrane protein beta-barrel domain-containing protein n=1 Tax=Urechidicola vernalis TaxID=3075600 RepID=A0ABU2YA24_9FLAO|nr:hypothetical protein [Urechidicola sp. P050]MDT0553918.1 hypothetical protein [Urechidicola sp. P050]